MNRFAKMTKDQEKEAMAIGREMQSLSILWPGKEIWR